jgi:hypothetical protein
MDRYEIKELIGDYLEGIDKSGEGRKHFSAALSGPIETNQGRQRYYLDIDTLLLSHIDVSEAIWSLGDDEKYEGKLNDIVFFDTLNDSLILRPQILSQENGAKKWKCFESIILEKLGAGNG